MSQRNEWADFEEIFKQSDSDQAVSVLRDHYNRYDLIKKKTLDGKGLLHMSVELDKPVIAEYLLTIGCYRGQINRQDGRSPLALALSLPHVSEELFRLLFVQERVCYIWKHITGHSKTLEFGNENIAEIFRSHVTSYLDTILNDDNVDDELIACRTVGILHHLGWPLESLSFLRLRDTSTVFAQLYYAACEADALKVKHYLVNNNYSRIALLKTLHSAVFSTNPKSTVITKLLIDKGAPLLTGEFDQQGIEMLDSALMHNEVDKALILMHSGIKFIPSHDYFEFEEIAKFRNRITDKTPLNVFVKPTIAFPEFLEYTLSSLINEDYMYAVTRYHSRIETFEFPQELKNTSLAYSLFAELRLELAKMKDTVVYENLKVLDMLDKPLDDIACYTYNEDLMRNLRAIEFETRFPCFSDVILKRLEVARRIRDWTDRSKDFLAECLPVISSNNLILSMIVKYVGVPNLIVMSLE